MSGCLHSANPSLLHSGHVQINLPSLILVFPSMKLNILINSLVSSVAQSCPTLCNLMDCSTLGFPVLYHFPDLLKLMSIESLIPSNHPILCCPLLPLPSIFPSIRVFSSEMTLCIRWPKYWSFSFSISLSDESLGLISFRIGLV